MWSNWGEQILALTYETPYTKFSNNTWIDNKILYQFGKETVFGIMEYLGIYNQERFVIDNQNAVIHGNWNLLTSNSFWNYYGESFLYTTPNNYNQFVEWTTPNLNNGKYDIYAMWQDLTTSATDAEYQISTSTYFSSRKINQQLNGGVWNLLDSVVISQNDQIKVRLLSKADGTLTADAIRVIYSGPATLAEEESSKVEYFILLSNFPNPFNSSTTIKFYVLTDFNNPLKKEIVKIKIYNINGEELVTLFNNFVSSGTFEVEFDPLKLKHPLSSGVYFAKLNYKGKSKTIKMVYLK